MWALPTRRPSLECLLSAAELSRVAALRRESDRARFVGARALLRLVLADVLGIAPAQVRLDATCPACGAPHGKLAVVVPRDRPGVHVSLAHAGERVLVAVTSVGPVGVDVEVCAATGFSGFDDIALTPQERAVLGRMPEQHRTQARASMWTRKEAILKMRGVGLAESPADLDVGTGADRDVGTGADHGAHLTDLDVGAGYRACVAVQAEHAGPVSLTDGRALLADPAARSRRASS